VLLEQFQVGPYLNFTYLVANAEGGEGVVIDPSFGIEPVVRSIDAHRVKVRYIRDTHSHRDHVAGNRELRERTSAKVVAHESAPLGQDISVREGDVVESGRIRFQVLHTPGHTPDSVLYLFEGKLATGDTLFVGECGRTDLPGGNPSAMYDSLLGRIVKLDDALVVLPGHDYGPTPTSTIGREKRENYVLQPRTRGEFIRFLQE
jgi:hydroxyacylglutathione hydrolase